MSGKRKDGETIEELRRKPYGWWVEANLSDEEKERLKYLDTASIPWHRQLRNSEMSLDDQIFIRSVYQRYIDTLTNLKDKAIGYCYIYSKESLYSSFSKRLIVSIAYDSGDVLVSVLPYCKEVKDMDIRKWNTPLGKILREYILSEDRLTQFFIDVKRLKREGTVSMPLFIGKASSNTPMRSYCLRTSFMSQAIGFYPSSFHFKDINDNLQGKLYVE